MRENIRQAVDANLSGLVAGEHHRLAIMNKIKGELTVKKRMPLSLALALMLVLISLAALAAVILGGRDVVDQKITPMALESPGNRFSQEEVEEIIAFAEQNGITLNENALRHLSKQDGYYKEELAMLFAKEQFGFYPGTWNIEEQHWFGQFWRTIDPSIINHAALPGEGEMSQAQIEQTALAFFEDLAGKSMPLLDPLQYRISRSFTAIKQNPWHTAREWSLTFEPLTLEGRHHMIRLDAMGKVLDHSDPTDIPSFASPEQEAEHLFNRFTQLYADSYGSMDGFSQATWQDLKSRLQALEPFTTARRDLNYILKQSYAPPEGAISREQAIDKAASAVAQKYKLDKAVLLDTSRGVRPAGSQVYALYLEAEGQRRWKVSFEFTHLAEVDAISGEVEVVDAYSPGNDHFRRYALDVLIPEDRRAFATQRPVYSDQDLDQLARDSRYYTRDLEIAPAWYWDRLDSYELTGESVHAMYYMLESEYGLDNRFWPIDYQALDYLRDYARELAPGMVFPGLPMEGDIAQEEAIRIAREAVLKRGQEGYGKDRLDSLKDAVSFSFNSHGTGSRTWQVELIDITENPLGHQLVQVNIDARDGQVRDILFPWDEHGGETVGQEAFPPSPDSHLGWSPLGPDGRPLHWRNPTAPDSFWQVMEKDYGSRELVAAALYDWQEEYGENLALWPLEANAVYQLWIGTQHIDEQVVHIAAWPEEGMLGLEQAKQKAIKAFQEIDPERYSEENLEGIYLKCLFYYQGGKPRDGQPDSPAAYWLIELSVVANDYNTSIGAIILDATDGNVVHITSELGNG